LSQALKIVINSVYGYTTANFDNPFKDPRNVDNIVAKRGALFMINLKHEVQDRGFTVAHIKTDSIKIPNADLKIIKFIIL
jgi:DNA polymerase elongation subunit (family B)